MLQLNKETIQDLTADEADAAQGGWLSPFKLLTKMTACKEHTD
jgi:hypothetical protein